MRVRPRIGLVGAWSIDNTGDGVLALAARQAIAVRVPAARILALAPQLPGRAWRHRLDGRGCGRLRGVPAAGPPDWADALTAVVFGGGGLISFRRGFRCFQSPGDRRWPRHVRAAWNAVGYDQSVWLGATGAECARLVECCQRLAYVSVRSRATATLLAQCGYTGDVPIVPDPAIGVEVPAGDRSEAILRRAGAASGERFVGVSLGPAVLQRVNRAFYRSLIAGLAALPFRALILPFGNVYGDAAVAAAIGRDLRGSLVLPRGINHLDRWRLIGRLDAYAGSRLHGIVAAYTQNVPFLAVDENVSRNVTVSKLREFCVERRLESRWTTPRLESDPGARAARLLNETVCFRTAIDHDRQRLGEHYDALVSALLPPDPA